MLLICYSDDREGKGRDSEMATKVCFFFFLLAVFLPAHSMRSWTYLVKKQFDLEHPCHAGVPFKKTELAPFSQLIFSWNADEPEGGYFCFWVRVHRLSGRWGPWHKMVEWGKGERRSFTDQLDDERYCYVRLELPTSDCADGFELRVESVGGADPSRVKLLAVALSNFSYFEPEIDLDRYRVCPPVFIEGIVPVSQMQVDHPDFTKICSPTSLCMLVSYLKGSLLDPIVFAQGVYDNGLGVYGSWPFNLAYAYQQTGGDYFFCVQRLHSFATLYNLLSEGIPVVVSVRGMIAGAPKPYPGGHLLVVVGFDGERGMVLCQDPAAPTGETVLRSYPLSDFKNAWEASFRLAYVISRR